MQNSSTYESNLAELLESLSTTKSEIASSQSPYSDSLVFLNKKYK